MAINYPTSLDSFTNPTSSNPQNNPSHSAQHSNENDAIVQLETKLGTGASTPTSGKLLRGTGTGTSDWGITLDTDGTLAGNSDTSVASQKAVRTYFDNISYGMARQAIMNGNFDVWQRGTSVALIDLDTQFLADRWRDNVVKDGGTLPTLTRSRQILTAGDIPNAFYFTRLTTDGAGTSLGSNSQHIYYENMENANRNLCGNGKKLTLSFYARSSITNKKLGIHFQQYYGTGGSPSATEEINGTVFNLTSTWTKYTYTVTTNTLVGKTFGSNGDDCFGVQFWSMWGSNKQSYVGASSPETFVGAGNIDIAQVQLCAGDVALPFQPKSYEEELRACQRYYEKSNSNYFLRIYGISGQQANAIYSFKVTKRTNNPTVSVTNLGSYGFDSAITVDNIESGKFNVQRNANTTGYGYWVDTWTADAEL